mmetsp:Transcript_74570/g.210901  ORF Transcript_74570/g.210901 Transcript_74570/m.210901 type:complete len:215 (-) Transcript_74570:318-962(-)
MKAQQPGATVEDAAGKVVGSNEVVRGERDGPLTDLGRQAEVGQVHGLGALLPAGEGVLSDEYVVRLKVAVHDTGLVRTVQLSPNGVLNLVPALDDRIGGGGAGPARERPAADVPLDELHRKRVPLPLPCLGDGVLEADLAVLKPDNALALLDLLHGRDLDVDAPGERGLLRNLHGEVLPDLVAVRPELPRLAHGPEIPGLDAALHHPVVAIAHV